MNKNIAIDIMGTLDESSQLVDKALGEQKGACPPEAFRACAKLLGYAMSDMFDNVKAPIYNEHPELAPEWYRDGPPRTSVDDPPMRLPPEARRALLAAFESAYKNVQSALDRVTQMSDPLEAAFYSEGFHQISVRLCRARVALLRAELE